MSIVRSLIRRLGMFTKIYSATITVKNQDAALAFYVGTLGWEKRIDNMMGPKMRYLTVGPKGCETELALGQPDIMGFEPGAGPFSGEPGFGKATGISLVVDDVDASYRELLAKGVKFHKAPEQMPWGDKAVWMSDPDGNVFFVVGR